MAEEGSATATQEAGSEGQESEQQSEFNYPAGTSIADMNPAQQAEYWREKAQKHEAMLKAERRSLGGIRAEELAQLREKADKHDALELELSSEAEKAAAKARAEAQAEADGKYRPLLAETAFRLAIGERKTQDEVDDFIADLNLDRFLTDDGRVDTAKVLARVEQFAPATGPTQPPRQGPSSNGQGARSVRSAVAGHSVSAGRDLYEQLHPPKK